MPLRAFRSWLKQRLQLAAYQPPSVSELKYEPYRPELHSFAIPRQMEEPAARDANGLALPPPSLWQGYANDVESYVRSGKTHFEQMSETLAKFGGDLSTRRRILDFGCGAGRMIRHLQPHAAHAEIWGTDISSERIFWCQQHLEPPFHFAVTTTIPHLPFPDRHFDLIYCGSVFTHIDDLARAWLLELRRLTSPDGLVYLTIQDHHSLGLITDRGSDPRVKGFLDRSQAYARTGKEFQMLAVGRDTESCVFYDRDFFLRLVNPFFRVVAVCAEGYGYQTALLLGPADAARPS